MHPDMDMHPQYSQHHLPHSQSYGPAPGARGPAHARTHSRSSSGSYPQHVPYPVPHHEIAPPGFQGPVPGAPPPPMVAQPDSIISDSRHVARYSSSQSVSSGYHVPPPHVMGNSSESAWQAPAPYGVTEQHLHQRPAHHPHPYHAPPPPSSHIRSHSRSHSHSQPQQQQQYAPHQVIHSPPPPRHATPPGPAHRYVQDTYVERVAEPIRFPAPVPHQSNIAPMADDDDEQESDLGRLAGEHQGPVEDDQADASKCPDCGKVYKHATSLMKHRWEHSVYWKPAAKFLLSKHQQVQLMEAAAILLGMDETRDPDRDPIVCMFSKQRGVLATGTSTSAASPSSSSKSLSASPPPPAERGLAMKEESLMTPPASISSYHGRVSNTTRHSVASTTSTASSLTSTPPSLAPDDESVAEAEDDGSMAPPSFRHHHHHHQHQHPQPLQHHHHPHSQHHPMMMGADMMGPDPKHVEPEYYPHERYPSYPHPQQPYAPYYHSQH
ncbi:hypothetical protein EC968_007168 [Mortierella alpina]|nr:hypothetical protein EC968_007168 [Mortierella alpina]